MSSFSLPISSKEAAKVAVCAATVVAMGSTTGILSQAGTIFVGLIGVAYIETISKWHQDLTERERSLLTRENRLLTMHIKLYRIAPSFPADPSQIDDQTLKRALEKINRLKSYQWTLKQNEVDQKQVLEYWKQYCGGTCFGQVSVLLHANKANKDFSLKKSFESLTLEEIVSRQCAFACMAATAVKKGNISLSFKAKQITRRQAQFEALLQQASIESDRGIPRTAALGPFKQWAREISDPDLERIVDQILLKASKLDGDICERILFFLQQATGRPVECWRQLEQWILNPPEISAADRELKLKKYEKEEKLLAELMAYPISEVFDITEWGRPGKTHSRYNAFPADSSPEEYQAHLEKAIASFPSRIRDGVITGTIIIPGHAMAFQYGPEYFFYDSSGGLLKYPDKETFFESICLILQNYMPRQMSKYPNAQPVVSFHIFNPSEPVSEETVSELEYKSPYDRWILEVLMRSKFQV